MATAPSPNDLTRQQLDELDLLLQRMLALPLNPVEAGSPAPPATPLPDPVGKNWRVDPPAAEPIRVPHLLAEAALHPDPADEPAAEPPPAPRAKAEPLPPIRIDPNPAAPVPVMPTAVAAPVLVSTLPIVPLAPTPEVKPEPPPTAVAPTPRAIEPEPLFPAPKPAPVPRPPVPAPVFTMVRPPEPVPAVLVPLVALNRGFDAVAGLFGLPGRVLRSGFGKNVLGVAGLGLLAYTAAHVAQFQGWVSLPVPLPWPR